MALTDFFRINLPYGMEKNELNEWFVFNREYMPLGWNKKQGYVINTAQFAKYPVFTEYKGLTDNAILKIIKNPSAIYRKDDNKIFRIYFYNYGTNPQSNPKYWQDYFDIIKQLSKFKNKIK